MLQRARKSRGHRLRRHNGVGTAPTSPTRNTHFFPLLLLVCFVWIWRIGRGRRYRERVLGNYRGRDEVFCSAGRTNSRGMATACEANAPANQRQWRISSNSSARSGSHGLAFLWVLSTSLGGGACSSREDVKRKRVKPRNGNRQPIDARVCIFRYPGKTAEEEAWPKVSRVQHSFLLEQGLRPLSTDGRIYLHA